MQRTEAWKISGDPTLRKLTVEQDVFNCKIDFVGVRTVADIESINLEI